MKIISLAFRYFWWQNQTAVNSQPYELTWLMFQNLVMHVPCCVLRYYVYIIAQNLTKTTDQTISQWKYYCSCIPDSEQAIKRSKQLLKRDAEMSWSLEETWWHDIFCPPNIHLYSQLPRLQPLLSNLIDNLSHSHLSNYIASFTRHPYGI